MSPVVVPTAAPTRAPGRRGLGLWMATALVVGNMIGSGIFLLPSSLAGFGSISIVGWVLTAGGALMLALVFARLGRAFPTTGGPYAYARRAFGDFTGFLTAWGYWIAVWVGNAAIAVAFVGYLGYFWGDLGRNRPLAAAVAIGAVWLLTAVNAAPRMDRRAASCRGAVPPTAAPPPWHAPPSPHRGPCCTATDKGRG